MQRILLAVLLCLVLNACQSIHYYAQQGNSEKINSFLAEGGDIDEQNAKGETALMRAVARRDKKTLTFLLDAGANVNARYAPAGLSPLRIAIEDNNLSFVTVLIEAGADVNLANEINWTPLMSAARDADIAIIQALLDAGADYTAKTILGRDIIQIAEQEQRIYVAAYLRSHINSAN